MAERLAGSAAVSSLLDDVAGVRETFAAFEKRECRLKHRGTFKGLCRFGPVNRGAGGGEGDISASLTFRRAF